jgi:serine/threonine-protein kinase
VTQLVAVVLMENEPPLRAVRPDAPEGLEQVVARCLAKTPAGRFPSVADLAAALEPFSSGGFASFADRVRGVAEGSGRLSGAALPPTGSGSLPRAISSSSSATTNEAGPAGGSSSSRINVHGGTSVAWGETQIERAPARSKLPIALGSLLALIVVFGGLGAAYYMHYARSATPPAPAEPLPLPSGRKDLPPIVSLAVSTVAPTAVPSELPDSRLAPPPVPSHSAQATPPRPPPKPGIVQPVQPKVQDDPLNNIGRR